MDLNRSTKRRRLSDPQDESGRRLSGVGEADEVAGLDLPSQQEPSAVEQATSDDPPLDGHGRKKRKLGKGRPPYELNNSARRGLIRWFIESPKSLKKIEEAVRRHGGPARLWLRNFFTEVTDGTNTSLDGLRMKVADPDQSRDDGDEDEDGLDDDDAQDTAHDPNDIQRDLNVSLPHVHTGDIASPLGPTGLMEMTPAVRRAESEGSYRPRNLKLEDDAAVPSSSQISQAAGPLTGLHDMTGPVQVQVSQAPTQAAVDTYDQLRTTIQFPDQQAKPKDQSRETTDKGRPGGKCSRNKRRDRTMSLKNPAIDLDEGKKGFHYRLAKIHTITRQMSSAVSRKKFADASCEFDVYYRPKFRGVAQPPPSEAIRIMSTQWAKGTDHRRDDIAARDDLYRRLEQLSNAEAVRETFVTTTDSDGISPLHLAVAYGYPLTCQLLIKNGASYDVYTNRGTSIDDFAEPAARRAGLRDMGLYFRILHCRKFVKMSKTPLAASPRNVAEPEEPSSAKTASPAEHIQVATSIPPHTQVQPPRGFGEPLSAIGTSAWQPSQYQPWYPGAISTSPTTSGLQKQYSLPFSDDENDSYLQQSSGRRTTVSPLLSSPLHYSGTSLSMNDSGLPLPAESDLTPSRGIEQAPHRYGNRPPPPQTDYNPPGSSYENLEAPIWNATMSHAPYSNALPTAGSIAGPMYSFQQERGPIGTNTRSNPSRSYACPTTLPPHLLQSGYSNGSRSDTVDPHNRQMDYSQSNPLAMPAQPSSTRPAAIGVEAAAAARRPASQGLHQYGFASGANVYNQPAQPNQSPVHRSQRVAGCPGPPQCPGYVSRHEGTPPSFPSNRLCDPCFAIWMGEWATAVLPQ